MHRIIRLKEISDIIIILSSFWFELKTVPNSFPETPLTSLKSLA